MNSTLIDQGLNLMLYGMSTVFVFLTILVFATLFMSRVVNRFSSEEETPDVQTIIKPAAPAGPSPQILQAIKLAIAEHRKN
ncbi:MAG: OadG family protein [Pseudomonadota bacterium]